MNSPSLRLSAPARRAASALSALLALSTPALPVPARASLAEPLAAASGSADAPPTREEILMLARTSLLDSAFAVCNRAVVQDPENAFLLLMMGKLSADGKGSSAYFRKAVKAGGDSPEAEESLFRLGQLNYAAGKYALAIPFFRENLTRFPSGDWKAPAQYWMGNACLSLAQGRAEKAAYLDSGEAWFRKMLSGTRPEDYYHPLAWEGLAKAKAARGDREGAWEAVRTALDKAPEEEQAPLLLLAARIRQSIDREEEKRLLARLMARYPQSPEARYLRKLNAGTDTSRWKSGSGLPRPAPPALDSVSAPPKDPQAGAAVGVPSQSNGKSTETSTLSPPGTGAEKGGGAAGGYTLQLGAFSQAGNAQAMMANLAKAGLAPELIEALRGGKRIYQVRLGRFPTAEDALEYARLNLKPKRFLSQPVPLSP